MSKEITKEVVALDKHDLTLKEVEKLYGDGEPYNYEALVARGQGVARLAYESMQELGKICIRLKAHEPHGKYIQALERMSVSRGDSWFATQSVLKLGTPPNDSPVNHFGKRKTRAILTLEKADIKTYLEGGDLGTIPHDDVEQMSTRELEAEIRKLRDEKKAVKESHEKQIKALESVVKKKETKISDLELENANRQPPTKQDIAQAKVDELRPEVFKYLRNGIYNIGVVIAYMDKVCRVEDVTIDQITKLTEVMNPHLAELKDAIDDLGDLFENAYPIKEEAPCTSGM